MKHLKTIIGIAALCALFSCAKSQTDGCGQVVFEVAGNHEVADVTKVVYLTIQLFHLQQSLPLTSRMLQAL